MDLITWPTKFISQYTSKNGILLVKEIVYPTITYTTAGAFGALCVLLPFVGFHFHQSILCEISCVTVYEKVNRGFNFSYYCWKHLLYSCRLDWSSCRNVRHRIKNCWQVHEQYIHVALIDINMLKKRYLFNSWDYFYLHDKSTQWSDKSTWITDKWK